MADYFISDLHLSEQTPTLVDALAQCIERHGDDMERLYILGDLFDYWIGDDFDSPCANRCAELLQQLPDVYFMAGNRDFLIGQEYANKVGCTLLPDSVIQQLAGRQVVMAHGDQLCTDDTAYQQARLMLRSAQWQDQFLQLSIAERIVEAQKARQQSQQHGKKVSAEITDVNSEAVQQYMAEHQATVLLHGHTHRPALHRLDGEDNWRIVLGDWQQFGWYIRANDAVMQLVRFPIAHQGSEDVVATIGRD